MPSAQQQIVAGRGSDKGAASGASAGAAAAAGVQGAVPGGSTECTAAAAGAPAFNAQAAGGRVGAEGESGRGSVGLYQAPHVQQAAAAAPGAVDATLCNEHDVIVISSDDYDDCEGQGGDQNGECLHPGLLTGSKCKSVCQQGRVASPGLKAEQGAIVGGGPSSADREALAGRPGAAAGTGDISTVLRCAPLAASSKQVTGISARSGAIAAAAAAKAASVVQAETAAGSQGRLQQPSASAAALGDPSKLAEPWSQAAARDSGGFSAGATTAAVTSAFATRAARAGLDGNPNTIMSAAPAAEGVAQHPTAGADAAAVCYDTPVTAVGGTSGGNAPIRVVQSGATEAGVRAGGVGVTGASEAPQQYVLKDTSDVQEAAEEVLKLCGDLEV